MILAESNSSIYKNLRRTGWANMVFDLLSCRFPSQRNVFFHA
jgi:hypothetical protein